MLIQNCADCIISDSILKTAKHLPVIYLMRLLQLCVVMGYIKDYIWAGFFQLFWFYMSVVYGHVVVNIPNLVVRL